MRKRFNSPIYALLIAVFFAACVHSLHAAIPCTIPPAQLEQRILRAFSRLDDDAVAGARKFINRVRKLQPQSPDEIQRALRVLDAIMDTSTAETIDRANYILHKIDNLTDPDAFVAISKLTDVNNDVELLRKFYRQTDDVNASPRLINDALKSLNKIQNTDNYTEVKRLIEDLNGLPRGHDDIADINTLMIVFNNDVYNGNKGAEQLDRMLNRITDIRNDGAGGFTRALPDGFYNKPADPLNLGTSSVMADLSKAPGVGNLYEVIGTANMLDAGTINYNDIVGFGRRYPGLPTALPRDSIEADLLLKISHPGAPDGMFFIDFKNANGAIEESSISNLAQRLINRDFERAAYATPGGTVSGDNLRLFNQYNQVITDYNNAHPGAAIPLIELLNAGTP